MEEMNMRNKLFLLLIPFVVITALLFTTCGESETTLVKKSQCTITFYALGANANTLENLKTITIPRGSTMNNNDAYPEDPEHENADFLFFGWWDNGIEYNGDSEINSDLDLKAQWASEPKETFTVTFTTDGSPVNSIKVQKNKPIGLRLPVSRKKNYTFNGWFTAASGGAQYTALSPNVTGDITLTAQWTIKGAHTVKFNTCDQILDPSKVTQHGGNIAAITVYDGEGIEDKLPGVTDESTPVTHNTNSKVKFVMWIGEENELYDEFTPITKDMTFYAKWGLDPIAVNLSKTTLLNGENSFAANPQYYPATAGKKEHIKNANMYDGSLSRWQIMYRIQLNLPDPTVNMGYYTRYNVRAKFYGNTRAIKGHPDYSSGYMEDANAIKAVGDFMPAKAGYGQLSWCVTPGSNGNPGNDKPGVIAQQFNLGTDSTINAKWLIGGDYAPADGNKTAPPKYLLIQTSDNWIGWIEIYEIVFHNGEEEFLTPFDED
jgi:uncharacterized repeat protein (TIGR02543 family)